MKARAGADVCRKSYAADSNGKHGLRRCVAQEAEI